MSILVKVLIAILGVLLLALFAWLLLRERIADRARVISQTIAREYRYRESPAWERSAKPGYVQSLRIRLKVLGE